MKKALRPAMNRAATICRERATANSIREPRKPMTNTGNHQLPNGGITASGGRRALVTCPSVRYVLSA